MDEQRIEPMFTPSMPRRKFLALGGMGVASALFLLACGDDDRGTGADGTVAGTTGDGSPDTGQVLVGDVLDHRLASSDWTGQFGWVRFRLHEAAVDGDRAYFIRTDASDREFAAAERLVFVPLMANASSGDGAGLNAIYLFDGGAPDQVPVLRSAPHLPDYSPAFLLHRVRAAASAPKFGSAAEIEAAAGRGEVELERTSIVVNYPVVKWPGGELSHDAVREVYLGDGQLIEPVDVAGKTVTFKLHACYPNSRYIVTDATMMADMMKIAPAPGAAPLTAAGATAKILVFGNGVEGSGPMGAQKSVTDTAAGDGQWSPYWDHYTLVWADGAEAKVLRSEAEILEAESRADLTRFNGVPESHPTLFMVNCPVPVTAPVA